MALLEAIVVAVIVTGAIAYAAWALLPPLRRLFGRGRATGGACGGCDSCGDKTSGGSANGVREQPVRIVRRVNPESNR